jgi:5'/3'-nucleotidase SurE
MKILVTNDDGVDSVFYPPLVDIADQFGETFLCVPALEQSWRGKSMTRLSKFKVSNGKTVSGREAITPNGTPADCVRYACEVLLKQRPTLVFSGINYGLNSGIGYLSSSGTAGACFEGNLLGIPGICVSQELSHDTWQYLHTHHTLPQEVLNKVIPQAKRILLPAIKKILSMNEVLTRPLTWSINLPYEAKSEEVTLAPVSRTRYDVTYKPIDSEGFTQMLEVPAIAAEPSTPSDTVLVKSGMPSLTVIDIFALGQLREDYSRSVSLTWNKHS